MMRAERLTRTSTRRRAMKPRISTVHRVIVLALSLCAMGVLLSPSSAAAQQAFFGNPVAEEKHEQLAGGPLYWQVETFPTLAQAQAAAAETSLAAEVSGKA